VAYRRINIYECLSTADNSASSTIGLGVNTNIFNHVIVGGYPNDLFPLNVSIQRGVDQVIKLIQQNPNTDFVLVGTLQGAMIMSEVYKEIRTWPRASDCVGVFLFGNPERQAGRAFPSCPSIPTGHGIAPANRRLTNTPNLVWEFAYPGDPICTTDDSAVGQQATQSFDFLLEQYSDTAINLPGTLYQLWQQLRGTNSLYDSPTWTPLSGAGTVTVGGVSDNTRSAQQIAIDQLNNVIGPAHEDDYAYSVTTFSPPSTSLYITTTNTTTQGQFQEISYLGFGSRIIIPWSLVQPNGSGYSWSLSDTIINNALGATGYVVQAISTGSNVSLASPGTTLDEITLSAGNLILLKDQTNISQNGVYVWSGATVPLSLQAHGPLSCSTRLGSVNSGKVFVLNDAGESTWITSAVDAAYLSAGVQPPMVVLAPPAPSWASPLSQHQADFGAMATAFATRYQPGGTGIIPANSGKGILDYQIWDEPNVVENWPTGVSSSEYVGYLKAAYTGIKSVQSGATVIMGGLQSCTDQQWGTGSVSASGAVKESLSSSSYINREPSGFLNEIYGLGAKNYFNVVAYHPLSVGTRQSPMPPGPGPNTIAPSDTLYRVMSAHGDSSKNIYWTSVGYDSNNYTEQQQSDYLETLRWLANERNYVGGIAIYKYSD